MKKRTKLKRVNLMSIYLWPDFTVDTIGLKIVELSKIIQLTRLSLSEDVGGKCQKLF